MSCAEVMYQPYSPYFPYHHQRSQVAVSAGPVGPLAPVPSQATADYRKFSVVKPPAQLEPGLDGGAAPAATPDQCRSAARAAADEKEKAEAQYLSANCVLFAYYSGDISAVVDEHFARALSQAKSYSAPEASASKGGPSKDGPPMSHRNFPPSFWNSNYTPASGVGHGSLGSLPADLAYGADPYHHGSLLHPQNDPWHHYALAAGQTGHHFGHHPGTYHPGAMSGVAGASRFAPQYGSLLLQPSVRSAARLGSAAAAACASLEKAEAARGSSWYHDPIGMESNYGAYGTMAPMTEPSNSGYATMYELYKLQSIARPFR